jgi:hypothetical protein
MLFLQNLQRLQRYCFGFLFAVAIYFGVAAGNASAQSCCTESTGCGSVTSCEYFGTCQLTGAECYEIDCQTCSPGGNWDNFVCIYLGGCYAAPYYCNGTCGG